jgi:hypothetical protein
MLLMLVLMLMEMLWMLWVLALRVLRVLPERLLLLLHVVGGRWALLVRYRTACACRAHHTRMHHARAYRMAARAAMFLAVGPATAVRLRGASKRRTGDARCAGRGRTVKPAITRVHRGSARESTPAHLRLASVEAALAARVAAESADVTWRGRRMLGRDRGVLARAGGICPLGAMRPEPARRFRGLVRPAGARRASQLAGRAPPRSSARHELLSTALCVRALSAGLWKPRRAVAEAV